ncbi:peptidase C39 [Aphanothece hegewaldii CCALA 016]|uniref:Peptidase C39 n=1 Tax=Aphanothece hegewaldii CCALA 016 TaxID=2107694 RepID=A0A2T1LRM8_9CHRO|nr:ABC transporter transmembrane domain-containing protein [Aphanothece hegewaldii]PSF31390.1 peptidase C39 [Aphanothece hegewaldii CCALA 016]
MKFKQEKQELPNVIADASSLLIEWLLQNSTHNFNHQLLLTKFSKSFEIREFKQGEIISTFPTTESFYLLLLGQIRLLSFAHQKKREKSIQLLTQGEIFGADELFESIVLPYRAVAVNSVQVATINRENLQSWLKSLPELKEQWQTATQQRQRLIFFKTLTDISSLPSHQLQTFFPTLEEKQIAAGTPLEKALLGKSGRFWLRNGKIKDRSLFIGEAWDYPETNLSQWTAQTDVALYHLPRQHWETFQAIIPNLTKSDHGVKMKNILPNSNGKQTATVKTADIPQSKTLEVNFPKPLKRRFSFWQRYPFIAQQSSADCGAACLAMISQYWNKRISLNFLRNLTEVGRGGASLKNLAFAAERIGYQSRPVRASLSSLIEQKNPWIAHWRGDHYVVVYKIQGNSILIADPALGKKLIKKQEFLTHWSGYAILLDPTERLEELKEQKTSLGKFVNLLYPYRSLGVQILIASFLIQVFGLISPLFTQIILDRVVVNKSLTTLNVFAFGVLLFSIWSLLLTSVRQYLLSYLANRLDLTMISGFISHTLMLPLKFFESRHVGDIITRVNENQKIQRFLLNQVVLAWLDFLMGFIYLGLMFYYNWRLTLLVIALIPPILILTFGATPLLRQISREVFNQSVEQNSALVETITGISTVKATASERELRWRWEDRLTNYLNAQFRSQKLGINLQAASGLINSVGSTALLWYGATLVIQEQLTIGQFVAFNMLIGQVLSPILSLARLWDELQEVLISVERLNDIFDSEPEENPNKPLLILPPVQGHVKFENVTFSYDTGSQNNTLQNISFEVKTSQTIAIVGRSGSGKTTLVKLLQRLYQPNNGEIWIDGHDIRHVSPQSLRSQLGVVPQDCFLFSGTILENITLYRSEYTLEQAIEAAKLAQAHPFIQTMSLGYNTKVGERGANLSGGQRQRIAIARALMGNPPILILDEATSSLDTESEGRFQQNLARLSQNRTIFIIAHRLSTVRHADQILVLDGGILAEQGTHDELIARQGLYYYLARQQLEL